MKNNLTMGQPHPADTALLPERTHSHEGEEEAPKDQPQNPGVPKLYIRTRPRNKPELTQLIPGK